MTKVKEVKKGEKSERGEKGEDCENNEKGENMNKLKDMLQFWVFMLQIITVNLPICTFFFQRGKNWITHILVPYK